MPSCKTGCEDKNLTSCAIWALNDECMKNPAMMLADCPASCGVCSNVCENKNADCAQWAVDGQCEENKEAMLKLCPQSCGVCHDLEMFYHTGIEGDKDEL